jgi:hypothetical protein
MRHLKRLLFGIILFSSFGSAFADEYDPIPDIFDQIVNVIVPLLIVFLFDTKEDDKKKSEDNRESEEKEKIGVTPVNSRNLEETAERSKSTSKPSSIRAFEDHRESDEKEKIGVTPINSRNLKDPNEETAERSKSTSKPSSIRASENNRELDEKEKIRVTPINSRNLKDSDEETAERSKSTLKLSLKRAFDDFIYILSLFVLPLIIFYINHEKFASPLWIPIFSGAATGVIVISIVCIYVFPKSPKIAFVLADIFSLIHEICFIFYTRYNPVNNLYLKNAFVCLHIVNMIIGATDLLYIYYNMIKGVLHINNRFVRFCNKLYLIVTPIIQMLNIALLSGNGYYLTKLVLAINIIFLSRIADYAREKPDLNKHVNEKIGFLYGIVISAFGKNFEFVFN